ncbi:MAG: DUF4288 domain-containing protein [Flavobacteriales bacterium]|jgi:hypothetical protein|nr:DUF4288 domain-containing protein [Flavobacteriales bacterium]
MNWYSARLIFQIRIQQDSLAVQFDESVRLFQAEDASMAMMLARDAGIADETSFINVHGDKVLWKFIDVNMIHELGNIQQGIEVFSDTRHEEKPAHFIKSVRAYSNRDQNQKTYSCEVKVE